ncbi:MAG: hypothetical protein E7566_08055 [Ruminococcaceae bacterium]|nr:hypothetical protein [Oscillospiraceae bacterium]
MADIESTISSILSDPEAMRKIQDLGKTLGLTDSKVQEPAKASISSEKGFDISTLSALLSPKEEQNNSIDLSTISSIKKFLPLLKGFNKEDESTALLNALKPFLSQDKRKRLDDANKMLKVMRLLPILKTQGLF